MHEIVARKACMYFVARNLHSISEFVVANKSVVEEFSHLVCYKEMSSQNGKQISE